MSTKPNYIESELIVFDVCDTLYYSNTTFDFIKYVLQKQNQITKLTCLKYLTTRLSPLFIALFLLQKIKKKDLTKFYALKLLRGISKKNLYKYGVLFEQEYLLNKKIVKTHELLNTLHKKNARVVIISASLDPVVSAIAQNIGVEFISSSLKYDKNNVCTGELEFEMTGHKLTSLKKLMKNEHFNLTVTTDNFSDRTLVEAAQNRYIVVYSRKAKAFWHDLNPEYIDLYS